MSQEERLLALLGHCNSIVYEDSNYIQNIFYSLVFETLQKLLHTPHRPLLLMTIKVLTNIFAMDFKHTCYKQIQAGIFSVLSPHLQGADLELIDLVIQCMANILIDNPDMAHDFLANEAHIISDLLTTIEREPSVFDTIKIGAFMRLINVCFQNNQKHSRALLPRVLPMINETMEQLVRQQDLLECLLQGQDEVYS